MKFFNPKKLALAAALPAMVLTASIAQGQSLALPDPNVMSTGTYGDFLVYSLDLLQQCGAAGDPRCLPSGPFPVDSSAGQIAPYLLITQGTSTGDNYPPLVVVGGDNAFNTPTGNSTDTFNMSAANEPDPTFGGDRNGTWEVRLDELVKYLTTDGGNLVFLFGNNQDGAGEDQFQYIFATASILTAAGAQVGTQCYELFANTYAGGCTNPSPVEPTFDANGFLANPNDTNFVTMATDFCVDKVTGESYNIGLAGNDGDCAADGVHTSGGYYVKNNLGNNAAEFAAYSAELEAFVFANYLAHPDWVLSVNIKLRNLTDGGEDAWICSACGTSNIVETPEPGSLALLGVGLLSFATIGWRRRRKN